MGNYIIVERKAMLNGVEVEPIEVRDDGMEIYPQGTTIYVKFAPKEKATAVKKAVVKQAQSKLIDLIKILEPDTFENNYGWAKVEKEIQQFRDRKYLEKQKYWASEEGQERIMEMKYGNENAQRSSEGAHGFGEKV
ncbi:hypothetical protein [Bacillus paramycoides]|uniref:Uncharacterized protein n=1 Tax=Bacillus paramycoides TaxID=2026194 RepID=A0ABU6MV58_9BACI|nr:hypothetical protein [Bacillus paramycoides]